MNTLCIIHLKLLIQAFFKNVSTETRISRASSCLKMSFFYYGEVFIALV